MMKRIFVFVIALAMALPACQEDVPVEPPVYEITVVVVDTVQQPVAGARVYLLDTSDDLRAEQAQNPAGRPVASPYAFETGVPDGAGQVVFAGVVRPASVINQTVYRPEGVYVRAVAARVVSADTTFLTNDPASLATPVEQGINYFPFDEVTGGGQQIAREIRVEVR